MMERLTNKNGWCNPIDSDMINAMYNKLAAYEDAEEQGLLVRLPCKVGDTVYRVTKSGVILDELVDDIVMPKFYTRTKDGLRGLDAMWDEFGDTVFLTREEAEAALKGEAKDVG